MSMHKIPLTDLERAGLEAHGLARRIGKPDMLIDVFRQGVAWALGNGPAQAKPANKQYNRAALYIFKCPHDKTCNFIADCPECAKEEISRLREELRVVREKIACKPALQFRILPWLLECFGPEISADKLERGDRFAEESLELLQAADFPKERVYALVEYVYNRPKGELQQEVGGTMITLGAFCLAYDLDMHEAGEVELARINQPHIIEKIRTKQAAKPTGSALPIATPPSPPSNRELKAMPDLPEELFEFYPAMSAQHHEELVKNYARYAIRALMPKEEGKS